MPDTTSSTPAGAVGTAVDLKMLGIKLLAYQALAAVGYKFLTSNIDFLGTGLAKPWLQILWALPFLVLIAESWPKYTKLTAKVIIGLWILGASLGTIQYLRDELLRAGDARFFESWQRQVVNTWLRGSVAVNPAMLEARTGVFDNFQQVQDAEGARLKDEMAILGMWLADGDISRERYEECVLEIASEIAAWEKLNGKMMKTVWDAPADQVATQAQQPTSSSSWSFSGLLDAAWRQTQDLPLGAKAIMLVLAALLLHSLYKRRFILAVIMVALAMILVAAVQQQRQDDARRIAEHARWEQRRAAAIAATLPKPPDPTIPRTVSIWNMRALPLAVYQGDETAPRDQVLVNRICGCHWESPDKVLPTTKFVVKDSSGFRRVIDPSVDGFQVRINN